MTSLDRAAGTQEPRTAALPGDAYPSASRASSPRAAIRAPHPAACGEPSTSLPHQPTTSLTAAGTRTPPGAARRAADSAAPGGSKPRLIATAHCQRCGWTAGPGPAADIDRAAEKHTKTGHPTGVIAELARRTA